MTGRKLAKVILVLVFFSLLAAPVVYKRLAARRAQANASIGTTAAASRYGFTLQEVAQTSGVNFTHQAPKLDSRLDHIMPQVASMGAGVSIVDFDRDGWSDIYVTNSGEGSKNALFKNMKDGSFKDVAADLGVADVNQPGTGVSMGAVWGD
ncbi:MAG TPA: VCBS repeat-containing protein, partial [Pyrinomonadaceae bacterium]|nr:VCBS repeat-containing protein [Pyrinomonadaceae bacterium]